MSLKIVSPPQYQNWDCQACGRCCRGIYSVPITREERQRIVDQRWHEEATFESRDPFIERRGGREVYLARHESGACVFLSEQGRCRIHEKFGESAKPLACRLYPFVLTPIGDRVHVGLRFDCPAVEENHGRGLSAHVAALRPMISEVIPSGVEIAPPPPFDRGQALSFSQLTRLTAVFDQLLASTSLDVTRRVIACGNLAHLLHASKVAELGSRLEEFVEAATPVTLKSAEVDPLERTPPNKGIALLFRQVAGLFNRWDRLEDVTGSFRHKSRRVRERLRQSLQLTKGKGLVPALRADFPRVPFSTLEESFGTPCGMAADLLTRFYRVKLTGMDFFGPSYHGYAYLEGVYALLLTYPVILWTARAFALDRGQTELDEESLILAIRGIDAQHGRSPAFGLSNERRRIRLLTEGENLRTLTIWYGS